MKEIHSLKSIDGRSQKNKTKQNFLYTFLWKLFEDLHHPNENKPRKKDEQKVSFKRKKRVVPEYQARETQDDYQEVKHLKVKIEIIDVMRVNMIPASVKI